MRKRRRRARIDGTALFSDAARSMQKFPIDVTGSYTGMSADGSRPVQDADDL